MGVGLLHVARETVAGLVVVVVGVEERVVELRHVDLLAAGAAKLRLCGFLELIVMTTRGTTSRI